MQTLKYTVGPWHAQAQLEELETGKLMAIISVSDDEDDASHESRHTIVFEHQEGQDTKEETEQLVRRLLHDHYGV